MGRTKIVERKSGPMAGPGYGGRAYEEVPVDTTYVPDALESEVNRRYKIPRIKQQIAQKNAVNRGYRILKRQSGG